jgi:3-hydroxybutyryl-CoA dehydrogenase
VSPDGGYKRPAVAGSGTIACGVAAVASAAGPVVLLARSESSAGKAGRSVDKLASKLEGGDPGAVKVTTDPADLESCDLVVEAVVEEADVKGELLATIGEYAADADLATTTSSFAIAELGERSGHGDRLFGLHVFNPVPKMELVELCLPEGIRSGIAERAHAWCERIGKRAIEVPDQPGFVVNRLLFPFLFDAVRLMERTDMTAAEVDDCMTLGAGHPMGPLRLLDFVGIDVAVAIGHQLRAEGGDESHSPPPSLERLVAEGRLGRKSGGGFYEYGE